ncbi:MULTISPECIES: chromosome segregation protein SMC [Lysinibacillus]|uniref:Chromosome partition protein Smc n=1 Tax=Lysinibacillus antri TaxID=2498145 RepID=A0A432LF06_9BACI|nr:MULTISPECIES: chromosome segregation protein SMC [Lysinibacillus]RUL55834.1 chromosome segregation protein SMC [Lysinibacillus antri]TSI11437.1 chromosome segregation protein SMC [Lysinibacillus sp. BW-2-10]
MFLKRLEVIGFKSFADRISIDFVPGVTAVVGPNGSGKSNVTDAIRWVLGEQSAKSLRGSKMEDVIFAGSDSRKPLNFAEVTLVLNNEDEKIAIPFTEISVTRRVYRSGDSEYLLNNQQCRLKDITDLFLDSGLGKEAFSIISQGRVDEILNSRPDDRRTIFEEAAGVLKYKIRKKKAEHKLVETDENLHRVLDILHELDSRLEPLQIQASSAKDYVRMADELREIDIALMVTDLTTYVNQLQTVNVEYEKLKQTEQQQALKISTLEGQVGDVRDQLKQIDVTLDTAQEQLVEASSEVERWEGRKALMREKRLNAQKQLDQLHLSLKQLTEEQEELQVSEDEKKSQFAEKQKEVQKLKNEIKQLDLTLNTSAVEIEQEIEQSKDQYIDFLNEEATVKNELKHIEQQLMQQQETQERMSDRSIEMVQRLEQVTALKLQIQDQLQKVEAKLKDKLGQHDLMQSKLKAIATSFDEKQKLLYQAYQHQQQLKARKDTLAELESDFSGFFQGVKEILLARDRNELSGIEGAVAELIQVEGKYSKAIETALGAASQHIVTENEHHAQKAIGWLKMKRAGRATFLPKTVMKSRKLHSSQLSNALDHPAYISFAYELVSFDESNRTIVENLLGNVLVASNLEGASEIARACGFKYRVVTVDGDIINAGGSLTGGASKQQSSLFSRKAELDELVSKLHQMEASIAQAEKSVSAEKDAVAVLREQIEAIKLEGEELRKEEMEHRTKLLEVEVEEKSLKTTVNVATSEQSTASSRKSSLLQQKEEAINRLEQLKIELHAVNEKVEQLTQLKSQSETEKDALREQSAKKRSELAVIQEQVSQLQIATAELALKRTKANQQVEALTQEIQWLQNDDLNGPSEEEIEETVKQWSKEKNALTTKIQTNRTARSDYQQSLMTLEEQLKEMQRVHKGFLESIRSVDVNRSRIEFEINRLHTQLEEQYELEFEEAKAQAIEIEDVNQIRRKVKLLKQSIEELGPVNLTAIEEYERVLERHTFLTEQRNDLLEAQETLHEAIKEMDEEMSIRFGETFAMIQAQFKVVFRELFGGGQADLVLLDPTNLLETGIEIVAQPPGKKLQSLSLLSGGERALTAIALLFAILNTRPVPFVILDEVEAALDEANVQRYSEYLRKLSSDTQFIVITHRKGTMEGADVLYGITMQESGVSKLVSVKLEEEAIMGR